MDKLDKVLEQSFEIKTLPRVGPGASPTGSFLKRLLGWTPRGFTWEADPAHVKRIIDDLGKKGTDKEVSPGSKAVGKSHRDGDDELDAKTALRYRSLAATALYVAADRMDIQFTVKVLMTAMTRPRVLDWLRLERLARYLAQRPRLELRFDYQEQPKSVVVIVDADWAGDEVTRKSTDGGGEFMGTHLVDSWVTTQQVIALSSGESEFYAIGNRVARAIWTQNFLRELGINVQVCCRTDSSAAKGICGRIGTGKVRHLEARYLWVQQKVREKLVFMEKVRTDSNVADLQTKFLDPARHRALLSLLPLAAPQCEGRMASQTTKRDDGRKEDEKQAVARGGGPHEGR